MAVAEAQQLVQAPGDDLLTTVFARLAAADIAYCLLRGQDAIVHGTADDIDLLVAPGAIPQLRALLTPLGFVTLARRAHLPHHFFIGFDERQGRWIKLDVVTELAYGRPIPVLRTELAVGCLRDRLKRGGVFVPSPPDEFATLLLHYLLDKRQLTPAHRSHLTRLAAEIAGEDEVATRLEHCCLDLARLGTVGLVMSGSWETLRAGAEELAGQLAGRGPAGMRWQRLRDRVQRAIERRTRGLRERGLTVALLAPDGAGKTTLARGLMETFYLPTRTMYMGTNPASSTLTLPTTRLLARASGLGTWRIIRAFTAMNAVIEQGVRYRVSAYHRWRGRLTIFDRYPPDVLAPVQQGGPRRKQLRRGLLRALCPAPDLVIFLDAPTEVLYRRKQDHRPEVLEALRQRDLRLVQGSGRGVVIDAGQDQDAVRRAAIAAIWRHYAKREGKVR